MDIRFRSVYVLKKHEKHKNKLVQIESVAGGVKKRLENSIKYRKNSRLFHLDSIRNLPLSDIPKQISGIVKVEHRRKQMEKWKEEKERKRRDAASHNKKPFVTGIVHHPLIYVPPPPLKTLPSLSGRVTKFQSTKASTREKNSEMSNTTKSLQSIAPSDASFKPPNSINHLKLAHRCKKEKTDTLFDPVVHDINKITCSSHFEIINTKSIKPVQKISLQPNSDINFSSHKIVKENKCSRKSKNNKNKIVISKDTTTKSEFCSEERIKSPKSSSFEECLVHCSSLSNTPKSAEQLTDFKNISPCVTISRGKDNARKEMKKKMEEGLSDDDNSNMESVDHFRAQLNSEIKRITEMCDTWEKISLQVPLSETAMEVLLSAVGQGRLLVSQKLAQFGSLVDTCEHPEQGATLVTPADLHGFWDMVFMQVENVELRFKKLADLRDRNWVEEEQVLPTRKVAKVVKNRAKPAATSRLRDLIAAARKTKKEHRSTQVELIQSTEAASKTFEAGFFSIQSPVKSPNVLSTPTKPSLLQNVLSNETKKASASKNSAASLAILRASNIGKNVESPSKTVSEATTTPRATMIPTATPDKSIIKSTNAASTKRESRKKSIKVVLFNNSDIGFQDIKEDSYTLIERNGDSAEAYMDISKSSICASYYYIKEKQVNNKENNSNLYLKRQDALDGSPVLTRSRCKSMNTPFLDISENVEYKKKSRKIKEITPDKTDMSPKR